MVKVVLLHLVSQWLPSNVAKSHQHRPVSPWLSLAATEAGGNNGNKKEDSVFCAS
jgi:hypothetical protein